MNFIVTTLYDEETLQLDEDLDRQEDMGLALQNWRYRGTKFLKKTRWKTDARRRALLEKDEEADARIHPLRREWIQRQATLKAVHRECLELQHGSH
jgi:hypothetical protein